MPDFSEYTTPEEAAYALRDAWGLGRSSIDNLITIVEQHGILVTSFSNMDTFSGLIKIDDASTFIVAYSKNETSAARIHYDIAYGLGLIFLHNWDEYTDDLTHEEIKQREREAHEFADAFLLPATSFKRDAISGNPTRKLLEYYQKLEEKWKVPVGLMFYRAKKLGIIDWKRPQALVARGMRTHSLSGQDYESLDDTLLTADPALLKTAVMMLLQENIFTPVEFMKELSNQYDLSINPAEVENLLDLPRGTLSTSKVIDFKHVLKLK